MNDLTTTADCAAEISREKPGLLSNVKFGPAVKKSPLQVLVVDDEALIRWSVAETLTDPGLEVEQAVDACSALAAIDTAEPRFDVIVLALR